MALSRIRAQHTGASVAMEEISMEEEALLIQESAGDLAEAEAEIEDAQELADTSDALEDLAMVADGIDEASENEVALVEAGVQLATAGSDLEVEDVAPGLESYIGRRISTEGIKETARAIYDAIVRAIKKFWEKIKAFFRKTVGTLANLRRSAEKLRARAGECHGKTSKEKQIEVGSEINSLSIDYKAPKTGKAILDIVDNTSKLLDGVLNGQNKESADIGEKLADALNDFDADDAASAKASLGKVCGAFGKHGSTNLPAASSQSSVDTRYPAGTGIKYQVVKDIPGNRILVVTNPDRTGTDPMATAAKLRGIKSHLANCTDKDKDPVNEATVSVVTPTEAEKLADKIIDIVAAIAAYENGKGRKDADKAKERVEKAMGKAKERMEKVKADDTGVISAYRAALNLVPAYIHISGQLAAQMTSVALAASRGAIVVANKSLSQYH